MNSIAIAISKSIAGVGGQEGGGRHPCGRRGWPRHQNLVTAWGASAAEFRKLGIPNAMTNQPFLGMDLATNRVSLAMVYWILLGYTVYLDVYGSIKRLAGLHAKSGEFDGITF